MACCPIVWSRGSRALLHVHVHVHCICVLSHLALPCVCGCFWDFQCRFYAAHARVKGNHDVCMLKRGGCGVVAPAQAKCRPLIIASIACRLRGQWGPWGLGPLAHNPLPGPSCDRCAVGACQCMHTHPDQLVLIERWASRQRGTALILFLPTRRSHSMTFTIAQGVPVRVGLHFCT